MGPTAITSNFTVLAIHFIKWGNHMLFWVVQGVRITWGGRGLNENSHCGICQITSHTIWSPEWTGKIYKSLLSLSLSVRASTAPGLHILRSQVNRCPGFLESILFLRSPANLCLKRSAGGSECLCDLIFSVNEACYEWKGFPTGPEAFPAHHKSHRQFHGVLAPCEI